MAVVCPHCALPLASSATGEVETVYCPGCRRDIGLLSWPEAGPPPLPPGFASAAAGLIGSGGAVCFSCQARPATGVCDACGGYTCPVCAASWFGRSYCLNCLHTLREVRSETGFRHRAMLHDNVALGLLLIPIFVIPVYGFFLAILLAPVALFLVIRYRHAPRGVPPRGPFRLWLAGIMAVLLLLAGLGMLGFMGWGIMQIGEEIRAEMRTSTPAEDGEVSPPSDPTSPESE